MFHLTQYIVVNRGMPLEDIVPQSLHACGIAMFGYAAKLAHEGHAEAMWPTLDPRWGHPTRVWKGSKNELRLRKLAGVLTAHGIEHATVIEPDDGPLKGQMTALALYPGDKEKLAPLLNDFQNLRWNDVPAFPRRGAVLDELEAAVTELEAPRNAEQYGTIHQVIEAMRHGVLREFLDSKDGDLDRILAAKSLPSPT